MTTCPTCKDKLPPGLIAKDLTEMESLGLWESGVCPNCGSEDLEHDPNPKEDRVVCHDCLWLYNNKVGEPDAIGPTQTVKALKPEFSERDIEQRSEMQMASDDERSMFAEYHMMVKREGKEKADEWLKLERDRLWKHRKAHGTML